MDEKQVQVVRSQVRSTDHPAEASVATNGSFLDRCGKYANTEGLQVTDDELLFLRRYEPRHTAANVYRFWNATDSVTKMKPNNAKLPEPIIRSDQTLEVAKQKWLLPQFPLDAHGRLTSLGSINHMISCKPCSFAFTKAGCDKGPYCDFCHFSHRNTTRKNKAKRHRLKQLIQRKDALCDSLMGHGPATDIIPLCKLANLLSRVCSEFALHFQSNFNRTLDLSAQAIRRFPN